MSTPKTPKSTEVTAASVIAKASGKTIIGHKTIADAAAADPAAFVPPTSGPAPEASAKPVKADDPKAPGPVTTISGPDALKIASAPAPSLKATTPAPSETEVGLKVTTKIAPANGIMKRANSYFVHPSALVVEEGFNPRFDLGEIEELAKSIKANGIMNALRVKRIGVATFKILGGHRRNEAIKHILKTEPRFFDETGVPVVLEDSQMNDVEELIRMFEDNGGKPFLPLEEAIAYKKMRDAKMTIKQIVARVGKKHMHVQSMLALLESSPELIEAVKSGKVGVALAKEIAVITKGDAEKQKELTDEAVKVGKNKKDKKGRTALKAKVEDARRAKAKKQNRKLVMRALTDAQLSMLGEKMSEHLLGQLEEMGLDAEADLVKWMKKGDSDQKLAFTFGVLQAFKAAAGIPDTVLTF